MELTQVLLKQLFKIDEDGHSTLGVTIHMVSPTQCSLIERISSSGGDISTIEFKTPKLLEEALLKARDCTKKKTYTF